MPEIFITPVSSSGGVSASNAGAGNVGTSNISSINATNAGGTATTQLPSILATLPAGTLLTGFVLNRDQKGNPVLRTDKGDFLIRSELFLKIGSDVTVRIESSGRNFRANIVTVDGQPPRPDGNGSGFVAEADIIVPQQPGQAGGGRTPLPVQPQQQQPTQTAGTQTAPTPRTPAAPVLEGTILRPEPNAPAPTPQALPPGSQLRLQLVTVQLPAETPPSQPTQPQTPQPQQSTFPSLLPETASQPSQTQPQQPANAALYAAYQRTNAPVTTTTPVQQATTPAAQQPTTVTGTLVQYEPAGEAVVETPYGRVLVNTPLALPVGTTLKLQVLQQALPGTPLPPFSPLETQLPATLSQLGGGWQTLQQMVNLLSDLRGTDPQLILQSLNLPVASPEIAQNMNPATIMQKAGANIFFFLSTLKSGDVRSWLGEKAVKQIEDAGRGDLLTKAEGEFKLMRQAFSDPPPTQWQAMFVPVATNGEIRPLRWFSKRERKNQHGGAEEGDTRFVVEMELSQMGAMQLDGFVRKQDGATQFDLVVRTHAPLDDETRNDLMQIYTDTGEFAGYAGVLSFQSVAVFPVNPLEELTGERHSGVVA